MTATRYGRYEPFNGTRESTKFKAEKSAKIHDAISLA